MENSAQQDRDLHWSAVLETGAKAIDAHNQSLIFLINALFAPGTSCQPETHVCGRIEQTISFLVRGLGREEATMRASAYRIGGGTRKSIAPSWSNCRR